jgi:dTDP-4-dehydrorhamnose reductase
MYYICEFNIAGKMKNKVLIVGANGLVGQKLVQRFAAVDQLLGLDVHDDFHMRGRSNASYIKLDFSNYNQTKEVLHEFRPELIINAAGLTNVDACEEDPDGSLRANVTGPLYLAELARRYNSHFVHISSDYVFDGQNGPYRESDPTAPLSVYGQHKLESEKAVQGTGCRYTILRAIVIFGHAIAVKANFALWLIDRLKNGKQLHLVTDQWGNTTMAEDVAEAIYLASDKEVQGLYHVGNPRFHSRYDFALEIAAHFALDRELINPVLTSELNQKAVRPLRSGLIYEAAAGAFGFAPMELPESFAKLKQQVENG